MDGFICGELLSGVGWLGCKGFLEWFAEVDILGPFATLVAAYAGAHAAFRYQRKDAEAKEKKANIAAGNQALFTLMQRANALKLVQIDFINPIRNSPAKHVGMKRLLQYEVGKYKIDPVSLSFLDSKDGFDARFAISLEDNRFEEAMKAINERSRICQFEVLPAMEKAGIKDGQQYSVEEFNNALGDRLVAELTSLTDAVIFHVDKTIEMHLKAKEQLRIELKKMYPDSKFFDFSIIDMQQQSEAPK